MGEYADEYVDSHIDSWRGGNGRGWGDPEPVDKTTAGLRIAAHKAFDPIWQSGEMTRSEAYRWLAGEMGLSSKACHMVRMNADQCREVVRICTVREFGRLAC